MPTVTSSIAIATLDYLFEAFSVLRPVGLSEGEMLVKVLKIKDFYEFDFCSNTIVSSVVDKGGEKSYTPSPLYTTGNLKCTVFIGQAFHACSSVFQFQCRKQVFSPCPTFIYNTTKRGTASGQTMNDHQYPADCSLYVCPVRHRLFCEY